MRNDARQHVKDRPPRLREDIDVWSDKKIEYMCTGKRPMDARAFEYTAQEYCDDLKVAPKNQKFEFMAETKSNSPVLFSGKDFPCAFLYKHDVLRNKKHKSYFMKTGSYENTQNKRGTLAG